MTLLIVDPPWCVYCPLYDREQICCMGFPPGSEGDLLGWDKQESPDWCPLRKGDVVVRFKGGGLARLKDKWDAADAIFDLFTKGAK